MTEPPNDGKKGDGSTDGPPAGLTLTPDQAKPPDPSLPIPPEELAKLPKAVQEGISSFFGMATGPVLRGPDRLLERVPPEQATECIMAIIGMAREHTAQQLEGHKVELASDERKHTRLTWLAAAGMVLVFALIIVSLFLDKDAIVQVLVPLIGGLTAGSLGGYGIGKAAR